MNQGGREELFLPYPNKELLIPLFINGVHLCGVFLVFDRDQCREFAISPSAVFAGEVNAVVRVKPWLFVRGSADTLPWAAEHLD
jgi:hypothetical protein